MKMLSLIGIQEFHLMLKPSLIKEPALMKERAEENVYISVVSNDQSRRYEEEETHTEPGIETTSFHCVSSIPHLCNLGKEERKVSTTTLSARLASLCMSKGMHVVESNGYISISH